MSTPIKHTGSPRKPLSARAIKKTMMTTGGAGGAGKDESSIRSTGFGGGQNPTVRPPPHIFLITPNLLPTTSLTHPPDSQPTLQPTTTSTPTPTQTHALQTHLTNLTLDLDRTERLIAERDVSLDRANDRIRALERMEREMRGRLGEQVCVGEVIGWGRLGGRGC